MKQVAKKASPKSAKLGRYTLDVRYSDGKSSKTISPPSPSDVVIYALENLALCGDADGSGQLGKARLAYLEAAEKSLAAIRGTKDK